MKSLFISSTEPRSGKSAVAMGFLNFMRERVGQLGYIKPIGTKSERGVDEDIELISRLFKLNFSNDEINPMSLDEARELISEGRTDELLTKALRSFNKIATQSDFVLVEGTDYEGSLASLEFDINADIAKNLDAPVVLVARGESRTPKEIISSVAATKESFDEKGCEILGVVVTKVDTGLHSRVSEALKKELPSHGIQLLGVIPWDDILGRHRMGEIARKIGARVLFGHDYLNNQVSTIRVAAMTIGNAIQHFKDGMLLITPGDREDMILAAMVSRLTTTYPNLAGLVLSGGIEPVDSVKKLIGGLSGFNVPVLQVPYDTYDTAIRINNLPVTLYASDREKVDAIYRSFHKWIDRDKLNELISFERTPKATPIMFLNNLFEQSASKRMRIVLPEGDEPRTLKAASRILAEGLADIVLIGDEKAIQEAANRSDARIELATVINPANSDFLERYSEVYAEMRKHKGVTVEHAKDVMMDPIYFGTMMVHLGDADGLVSGAVHTTRHTITPAFQIIKTKPDTSLVSSIFFMCLEDKVLVYGDCAVNPNPNEEELADIAITSADTAKAFGFDPLIAMLSYSTGTSGVGPEVERVKTATDIVKTKRPNLKIEGPIQYDAAVSIETAKTKLPDSEVAGRANVFIFPDLNSGNTAYKAVQRSAKAIAVGPVLQGLNKPVNDLSRGALVEDIIYTICITAIQAQQTK